jgi:hypothetical protein
MAIKESQQPFGVLYFLDDNPHFERMLRISVESLRRFHPDWPLAIFRVPSVSMSIWRRIYRTVSFWNNHKRRARLGQDTNVIAQKVFCMLHSPFETTLYVDVDTVILNPLEEYLFEAKKHDVLITPLPWKSFTREYEWQPESWPYMMAGILFYNQNFRSIYQRYFEQVGDTFFRLPLTDMNLLSMTCYLERENLSIKGDSHLQVDHCNMAELLNETSYPTVGPCIDLNYPRLKEFGIFHYNDHKDRYLELVEEAWGLTGVNCPDLTPYTTYLSTPVAKQ